MGHAERLSCWREAEQAATRWRALALEVGLQRAIGQPAAAAGADMFISVCCASVRTRRDHERGIGGGQVQDHRRRGGTQRMGAIDPQDKTRDPAR